MVVIDKNPPINIDLDSMNVFFSIQYRHYIEQTEDEYYYCYNQNFIVPIRVHRERTECIITFLSEPYNIYCVNPREEVAFLNNTIALLSCKFAPEIIRMLSSCMFTCYPQTTGLEMVPLGCYEMDLCSSIEELWRGLSRSYRNQILRAKRNGVCIKECSKDNIDDYIYLEKESAIKNGLRIRGNSYYSNELQCLSSCSKLYMAYLGNEPQCGIILFFNKNGCYYRHAVMSVDMTLGAMKYLQWHIFEQMKIQGVQKFYFYGARINSSSKKHQNINIYKERFGGKLYIYYHFRIIKSDLCVNKFIGNDIIEIVSNDL